MIRAIWPSWDNYTKGGSKNSIPDSTGASTGLFVSFFLFWLGSLPFLWFPVHKLRHLFTVKSYVAPSAGIALFIWAIVRANGLGCGQVRCSATSCLLRPMRLSRPVISKMWITRR